MNVADFILQLLSTGLIVAVATYFLDARLQKAKNEFQYTFFTFGAIQTKRMDVISNIYAKLVRTKRQFDKVVSPYAQIASDNIKEEAKKAEQAAQDFSDYSNENALFLPKATAKRIKTLDRELLKIWHDFVKSHPRLTSRPKNGSEWDEAWDALSQSTVPAMLRELEKEMRELIGVDTTTKSS